MGRAMFETEQSLIGGLVKQSNETRESRAPAKDLACLVVSLRDGRNQLLHAAASTAGWQCTEIADPLEARKQVIRRRLPLVVIDLESETGSGTAELKDLAEKLARGRGVMLIICGNEGNAMEEIWARQLGAWLYLPGVTEDSDLASLFEEAGTIMSRRTPTAPVGGGWTPPAK